MNTQSVSQNGWLLRAVGLASAIMLTLQVSAENWIAATGSFTDGANWNNGTAPTNGAWAVIDNGGTALMDGGSVTCTFLYPGYTATGHLIQSGGDISVTGNSDPTFGLGVLEGSDGTYDVSGGSLSQLAGNFQVGGRGTGIFTQSGGVVTGNNWVVVGRYGPAGNGTLTVSGGTFLQNSSGNALIIAEGGTGSLTVTNTGVVNVNGGLRIGMVKNGEGDVGTGTGTVYLCRGGTISTPIVNTLGGSSTFCFDGGALCARGSWQTYGAFMQGLSAAYVRSGGAVIDTGSNAATINQNLLDGGGAGGLTKLGSGVLTLGGANTYSGTTVVSNGVLAVLSPGALPGYDAAGRVKVADGAGLSVGVGGSSAWTETQAYTLAATASFGSSGSFGFDTSLGSATLGALPDLGALSLVKTGANVLRLTGNNTYSGNATVCGGVLQADFGAGLSASGNATLMGGTLSSAGGSITAASGSGAGQVNIASNAPAGFSAYGVPLNVNLGGAGAPLQWGAASFSPNPLLLNETGADAALTFANGLDLAGGARTVAVNATAAGAGATIGGAITDSLGGGLLIKSGLGNLTLVGANSYVGSAEVGSGSLICADGSLSVGGQLNVGRYSGNVGSLVLSNGAAVAANLLYVGRAGSGTVTQTGGTMGLYGSVGSADGWRIGGWTDYTVYERGTGVYNLSGGTLDSGGNNLQIGACGSGTLNQSGGTANCGGWPVVGRFSGGTGVFTLSGGTFNQTSSGCALIVGEAGVGTLTVKDSGTANLSGGFRLSTAGGSGTVHLQTGGTVNTPYVTGYGTSGTFNFDGGVLRANGSSLTIPSFMTGLTTAKIGDRGALIDSNGKSITVAQNLTGSALARSLRHRWSFNGDLTDSVGGQTATAVGSVASGSAQYTLSGGANGTSYISLGSNILPADAQSPVTIELWATQRAIQMWSRVIDFGYGQRDYIIMSWTFQNDIGRDHVEIMTGGNPTSSEYTMSPYTLDTEYHIAMVLTPGAGTDGKLLVQWYKMDAAGNTLGSGSMSVDFSLANFPQTNMWLGHSEYGGDNDASASYNEVRIWNAALTEAQLKANSIAGPDSAMIDGGLTKLGEGTLVLTGTNGYAGPTTISNGVLRVGAWNAVPTNGEVRVEGGVYDLGGLAVTNDAVTLEAGSISGGTLCASAFNLAGSGSVYATLDGGSLTKSGAGTVTLFGANTYTGDTVVADGTLVVASSAGLLRHRWSFNGGFVDSVGGLAATAFGSVASGGAQCTLAGGARDTSYIDLGAHALPSDASSPATIEVWATQHAVQKWSRIFDFGSGTGNYLMMSWARESNLNQDRVEMVPNGISSDETMAPYALDTEYHISLVVTPGAGTGGATLIQWYKMDAAGNTLKSGSGSAAWTLASLVQDNMWLGHSQFGDNDASASYNEVRIWNAALTEEQLQESSRKGPDALPSLNSERILPVSTRVSVASSAALDLAGTTQTVASVSGDGMVSNGTLTVTGMIAPGGVGAIGTLTVASDASLAGTLLIDVAADGACDLLQSPGGIDVRDLVLEVQDDTQFAKNKTYTIVKCAPGALSGRFEATTLDLSRWLIAYNIAAGEVTVMQRSGMMIMIR